jgi:hypothetical protein
MTIERLLVWHGNASLRAERGVVLDDEDFRPETDLEQGFGHEVVEAVDIEREHVGISEKRKLFHLADVVPSDHQRRELERPVQPAKSLLAFGDFAWIAVDHQPTVSPPDCEPRGVVLQAVGGANLDEIPVCSHETGTQVVDNSVLAVLAEAAEFPGGRPLGIDLP